MAKRHTMTAKRRAALRKAQLASARKRKGRGKGRVRRAGREVKRRYQAGHTGPGAYHRRKKDYWNSSGYYKHSFGGKGRKAGKIQRGYRKVNTVAGINHLSLAVHGASLYRHNKAKKGKGKKRR